MTVYFLAMIMAIGTFFINLNLDQYYKIWSLENEFYTSFLERFPSIPDDADFMFDIQEKFPLGVKPVNYEAEHIINMLYAKSKNPEEFRTHKVTEYNHPFIDQNKFEQISHHGTDVFIPKELIVIRWEPGEFLINEEIVKKYPNVSYKNIADKPIPKSQLKSIYPLRKKLSKFLNRNQ